MRLPQHAAIRAGGPGLILPEEIGQGQAAEPETGVGQKLATRMHDGFFRGEKLLTTALRRTHRG